MSETWTEYGVKFPEGVVRSARHLEHAELIKDQNDGEGMIVGRNVTASDWLPVDTDGAK